MTRWIWMILTVTPLLLAQPETAEDPLAGRRSLGVTAELFLLYSQSPTFGTHYSYQKIYDYLAPFDTLNHYPPDQRLLPQARQEELDSMGVFGNLHMTVATGDFNEDGLDDIIAAWEGPDRRINMLMPHIDPDQLSWSDGARLHSPGPMVPSGNQSDGRILLATGDFDGDREDEFALAYHGADATIHIEIYDTDSTLTPSLAASINDQPLPIEPNNLARFAIVSGDWNRDGRAELALVSRDPNGAGSNWTLYLQLYQVTDGNGNYDLQPLARADLYTEPAYPVGPMNLDLASGDFDHDTRDEIAVAWAHYQGQQSGDDTWMYLIDVRDDLTTLAFGDTTRITHNRIGPNEMEAVDLEAGDINGDGRDEAVLLVGGQVYAYESDDNLMPAYYNSQSSASAGNEEFAYNRIQVVDIDRDGRSEVAIVRNTDRGMSTQTFVLEVYGVLPDQPTFTLKAELEGEEPATGNDDGGRGRHWAMVMGDFDGDNIRLGKPRRYFDAEIRQPLVILNAPPVHFDVIDGTAHDVNTCFNGQSCGHRAEYRRSVTTTGEMRTTLTMDWGLDTTLTGDVDIYGNGVRDEMSNSYGERFSRDESRRETFRINFSATAVAEDLIFGTVVDYVIWEYPVISSDTLRGYMTIVEPKRPTRTWYSSESWTGRAYIPNHEVGNILSYSEYGDLTGNDYLGEAIKLDNNVRFGLSPTSFYTWGVDWSSWSGGSVSNSVAISSRTGEGWSAGLDIDFFGSLKSTYGEEMNSTYSEEEITTHTTTVLEEIEINVELGTITDTDKRYDVTPYAYWGNNGAVVVDFAARPQLAPPGQPETWWQRTYGQASDPAFILPFRLHPEKGWPLADDAQRHFSKDIVFFPSNPQPGDTVTVVARLQNFSLLDTPSPVRVRFYIGDPDDGGARITGINGETFVETSAFIPFRGSSVVQMEWVLPQGTPSFPRIYAVADPDNAIADEIHETNNKAYNVLGRGFITGMEGPLADAPVITFELAQNYPNPFNPATTIEYRLGGVTPVKLKVFDVLGREVATLVNQPQSAGVYRYTFDGRNHASGIYFYRLEAGDAVVTRKMVLMK